MGASHRDRSKGGVLEKLKLSLTMKSLVIFLCLVVLAKASEVQELSDAEVEEIEVELEARRARGCKCPPLNNDIVCKKNQKKNKFYTDDKCKCPHFRCIWTVCPKIVKPKCKKCQTLVEVDDCGCKNFECQNVQPDHCKLKPVKCKKCEQLTSTKDECGCPQEKCVPLQNPPSQCG